LPDPQAVADLLQGLVDALVVTLERGVEGICQGRRRDDEDEKGGSYTMDHTSSVILTDADGGFLNLVGHHRNASTAHSKLRRAIRGS
jgi:cytochrome oxidase Cu insertion factor (SCO1/SenC/PrrC family)